MGRPLKIAKAQAVLTVTNTTATTNIVTVSQNLNTLGVIAGMPFIPSITTGTNLIAGTTFTILVVTGASTFTVSATPLNANPTSTPVTLTTGTTASALSVGVVDAYFNNPNGGTGFPATNANTYSVVGGNTAIFGKQVLANVCIGQNGTGNVFASTASNSVVGSGTDFGNVATGSHLYAVAVDGSQSLLGTVSATKGNLVVAIANTAATGNIIGTSGNAQLLVVNTPVKFNASFGNLISGTTYFVKTIANAAAFTVSATNGGAPQQLTSNGSVTGNVFQNLAVLGAVSSNNAVSLPFVQALPEAGYIVRQKGKQKYLVNGTTTGLIGACFTANLANTALTPNTMTITATYANTVTAKVQSLSDRNSGLFTSTSGPVATGNIVLPGQPTGANGFVNSSPVFASFNSAATANTANAQPYPIVTIGNA